MAYFPPKQALAEEQAIDYSKRLTTKIKPCCHLGEGEHKQVVFIFFDSRNNLHEEFLFEVEAR